MTDPHRSSQIPTLLFYLFYLFIFLHRSSQILTEPPRSSQISTTPSQILTDPHIFSPLLTTPLFIYRPGLSLWQVPPPSFSLPYFHPIFTSLFPPQLPTDPHKPLTYPHRSLHFLSLIYYPIILSTGPACYCSRSRFLPSFNSIHTDLLPFTDPHRSSQIPTLLSTFQARLVIVAGPASYLLPTPFAQVYSPHSFSQIFTNPSHIITYPHIFSPYLLSHHLLLGPACHRGRSHHIPSFHSIYSNLPPFTPPHRSCKSLSYYFTSQARLVIVAGPASYLLLTVPSL